jgi:tetratricopeptide (TPR) repeat protein
MRAPARILLACALAAIAAATVVVTVAARESSGTAAARAAFDKGETAARAGALDAAVAAFRQAIAADPDFVDAHQRLIEIAQRQQRQDAESTTLASLQRHYEQAARQHPRRAVYQVALGLLAKDPERADAYYTKALTLDAAFGRAHFLLAKSAEDRGDWDVQRQHLEAAVDSTPDEPRYLLRDALAYEKSDPARFRALARRVVDTFPTSQSAAEALYDLAGASVNPERRGYFDRARANYPVDRYPYAMSAMVTFYGDLTEPAEALALAREMANALPASTVWPPRVVALEAMTHAKTMIAAGQFAEAGALLEKTPRPSGVHGTTWTLLSAEAAAGAGHRPQAYASLVDSAATSPDARVDAALARYAAELGKSSRDADADVWKGRDARATQAFPFTLTSLRDDIPVRLADYRGRVVLLAFWYPT